MEIRQRLDSRPPAAGAGTIGKGLGQLAKHRHAYHSDYQREKCTRKVYEALLRILIVALNVNTCRSRPLDDGARAQAVRLLQNAFGGVYGALPAFVGNLRFRPYGAGQDAVFHRPLGQPDGQKGALVANRTRGDSIAKIGRGTNNY